MKSASYRAECLTCEWWEDNPAWDVMNHEANAHESESGHETIRAHGQPCTADL